MFPPNPNNNEFYPIILISLRVLLLNLFLLPHYEYQSQCQGIPVKEKPVTNFVGEYGNDFQGDIILTPNTRALKDQANRIWPGGKFYFVFAQDYPAVSQLLVSGCMELISNYTCIEFIQQKGPDGSYVEIVNNNAAVCRSVLGRQGGRQELNLASKCLTRMGNCAHGVMHALGIWHEMSRPDRSKYIKLNEDNIDPDQLKQFDADKPEIYDLFGSYYDYGSIMHFNRHAFAVADEQGKQLIAFEPTQLNLTYWVKLEEIGQRVKLSYEDVYKIQRLYNCCGKGGLEYNYNSSSNFPPIQNERRRRRSSRENSKMSRTALEKTSLKSQANRNHATFRLPFAQSLCKHHSNFVETSKVQGKMKTLLIKNAATNQATQNKLVIWKKCPSYGSSKCLPFTIQDGFEQKQPEIQLRQEPDHGEYGEHFQGDLINNPGSFNPGDPLDLILSWTWPSGVVPYRFDDHVVLSDRKIILEAMQEIERRTCITFGDPYDPEVTAFLNISTNLRGCFCTFGYNYTSKFHLLNLNPQTCLNGYGTAVHELLHVIGLPHEHTKQTRDQWLIINNANVRQGKHPQFDPIFMGDVWGDVGILDYGSIMMVPKNFHAKTPDLITIQPKEDIGNIVMGQRDHMTPGDVAKVLHLYDCCPKGWNTDIPNHHVRRRK